MVTISNFVSRATSRCGPRRDKHGRVCCECGGYHFIHHKGGGACYHSKTRDIHLALRYKDEEALLQAIVNHAWDHPSKTYTGPCPF
jgi:hypothetical protein